MDCRGCADQRHAGAFGGVQARRGVPHFDGRAEFRRRHAARSRPQAYAQSHDGGDWARCRRGLPAFFDRPDFRRGGADSRSVACRHRQSRRLPRRPHQRVLSRIRERDVVLRRARRRLRQCGARGRLSRNSFRQASRTRFWAVRNFELRQGRREVSAQPFNLAHGAVARLRACGGVAVRGAAFPQRARFRNVALRRKRGRSRGMRRCAA